MAVSIQNPAKCGVHAVTQFLHAKGETAAEIHRQLVSVYDEDVMNRHIVTYTPIARQQPWNKQLYNSCY
jgi:hypothetical protein